MLRPQDLTGVLLCGGASRRMGRDKALLPTGPAQDLLGRTAELLGERCGRLLLAVGHGGERYAGRGLEVVQDRAPDLGPLGGIQAGLAEARTPWVLFVPCDLPQLGPEALDGLLAGPAREPEAQVHVWRGQGGPEPLVSLVQRRCEPAALGALETGRRRVIAFWDQPLGPGLAVPRVHTLTPDEGILGQLRGANTAAEWRALVPAEGPSR